MKYFYSYIDNLIAVFELYGSFYLYNQFTIDYHILDLVGSIILMLFGMQRAFDFEK